MVVVGFYSGAVSILFIFDPLRHGIHAGDKLLGKSFIGRQFPLMCFSYNVQGMRDIY